MAVPMFLVWWLPVLQPVEWNKAKHRNIYLTITSVEIWLWKDYRLCCVSNLPVLWCCTVYLYSGHQWLRHSSGIHSFDSKWRSYTVWREWMPDNVWRSCMHVFMCLFWPFYCTVTLLHFNKDERHPTLQINHSKRVCYELYTYSIVSVHLMDAWSHKLISWSLNVSFDNCPNRWCVLHGVVNILVSHPYFGAPLPPRLRVPYHSGLILQGNLSFSQQPQTWQSAKSTPPWWSWNTTGRASRKSCRPCGKNR